MKLRSVEFLTSVVHPEQLPRNGLSEIAFSGRSNVGKSSLINTLVNRKGLAKTSKTPGKTRQLNYYTVNNRFYLVDLPGYGYAKAPYQERRTWAKLVEPYLEARETLRGIVQLLDCRHNPTALDRRMLEWLQYHQKPFLIALTKSDKLSKSRLQERVEQAFSLFSAAEDVCVVPFSTKTNAGRSEIWRWIDDVVR